MKRLRASGHNLLTARRVGDRGGLIQKGMEMHPCPENEVWLSGDFNAITALIARLSRMADRSLRKGLWTGSGIIYLSNEAVREDVIQETWVGVCRNFDADKGCVTHFFSKVLKRKTIDFVRKQKGEQKGEEKPTPTDGDDPSKRAAEAEWATTLSSRIPECFDKLTDEEKVLAGMSYGSDFEPDSFPIGATTLEALLEKLSKRVPEADVYRLFLEWLTENLPGEPAPSLGSVRSKLNRLISWLNHCTGSPIWGRKPPSLEQMRKRERDAREDE